MNKKIQIMRGLSIIAVIVIHTYNTNTSACVWGGVRSNNSAIC